MGSGPIPRHAMPPVLTAMPRFCLRRQSQWSDDPRPLLRMRWRGWTHPGDRRGYLEIWCSTTYNGTPGSVWSFAADDGKPDAWRWRAYLRGSEATGRAPTRERAEVACQEALSLALAQLVGQDEAMVGWPEDFTPLDDDRQGRLL